MDVRSPISCIADMLAGAGSQRAPAQSGLDVLAMAVSQLGQMPLPGVAPVQSGPQ